MAMGMVAAPQCAICGLLLLWWSSSALDQSARARHTEAPAPPSRCQARTREVKLGVFFTQDKVNDEGYPVRDRDSSSFIATFEPASVFAGLVKAEGIRRGADHVRHLTILGDGAAWIWNMASAKFPAATQIVDLYHAREHLRDLARLLEFMHASATRPFVAASQAGALWRPFAAALPR
jgi:hypothetical protein